MREGLNITLCALMYCTVQFFKFLLDTVHCVLYSVWNLVGFESSSCVYGKGVKRRTMV